MGNKFSSDSVLSNKKRPSVLLGKQKNHERKRSSSAGRVVELSEDRQSISATTCSETDSYSSKMMFGGIPGEDDRMNAVSPLP